jgi:3-deoxy-D-manno-octulosonic-acid transferase
MKRERRQTRWSKPNSRPIWIHAASGEHEYAKPIYKWLKQQYPNRELLITYTSPSARKILQSVEALTPHIYPLPFDFKNEVSQFLDFFNPELALFARGEIWPRFYNELSRRRISKAAFSVSATQSRGKIFDSFKIQWLNQLDHVFCMDSSDKHCLQEVGVTAPITIAGDTRFDQVIDRLKEYANHPKSPLKEGLRPNSNEFVFVCGSTWPEDERELFKCFQHIVALNGRIIIAPHEWDQKRIRDLKEAFSRQNIPAILYSSEDSHFPPASALIVDQKGILAELYTWGSVAFVGGSFRKRVHSVMEALAAGLPVIVGPFITNNKEAMIFSKFNLNLPHCERPLKAVTVFDEFNMDNIIKSQNFTMESPAPPTPQNFIPTLSHPIVEWLTFLANFQKSKDQSWDSVRDNLKNEIVHQSGASIIIQQWIKSKISKPPNEAG